MSIQLLSISDPRDNLEKARRRELVDFARANGLDTITIAMPANLIRKMLRQKGLTHIRVPARPLGQPTYRPDGYDSGAAVSPPPATPENIPAIDADDDLARQWQAEQNRNPPEKPLDEMTRLRREAKARGIKVVRTDNLATLRAKLRGQDAA